MLKGHRYTILFISWVILITSLSLFSFSGLDVDDDLDIPHLDKITHFIFYFVFVVLGFFAIQERQRSKYSALKIRFGLFIAAMLYGILIEVVQSIMPYGRMGELWDILANGAGALLGAWLTKKGLSLSGKIK